MLSRTYFLKNPTKLREKYKDSIYTAQNLNNKFTSKKYNEALFMITDMCILISIEPLINFRTPNGNTSSNRPVSDLVNNDMQHIAETSHNYLGLTYNGP